jgi:hypothetical protein
VTLLSFLKARLMVDFRVRKGKNFDFVIDRILREQKVSQNGEFFCGKWQKDCHF